MNGPNIVPTSGNAAAAAPRSNFRPAATRPVPPPRPTGEVYPILTWLRLHALTIAFCGTILGGVLAAVVYQLLPAEYESYGLLRVASAPFSVANQKDPNRSKTDFSTYLKTNSRLIKYEFVLNAAMRKPTSLSPDDILSPRVSTLSPDDILSPRVSTLSTLAEQTEPIKYLTEKLEVSWAEGDEVIRVALRGSKPKEIQTIVNSVLIAFMDEVIEKEFQEKKLHHKAVSEKLAALNKILKTKAGSKKEDPAVEVAGGPLPPGAIQPVIQALGSQPKEQPESVRRALHQALIQSVVNLKQQLDQYPAALKLYKSRMDAIEAKIKEATAAPLPEELVLSIDFDPEVQRLQQKVIQFRNRYAQERASYANPDVPSVRGSLDIVEHTEQEIKKLKQKKLAELETIHRRKKSEPLYAQLDESTRFYRDLQDRQLADGERLKKAEAEMATIPADPIKPVEHKETKPDEPLVNPHVTDLLATDDMYRNMSNYETSLFIDLDSPKRVSILQTASAPLQRDTKKQLGATILAGLFGYALVAAFAGAYEFRVRKLCSVSEAKGATPLAVVGVVPNLETSSGLEYQEAIDKLRSFVTQSWLARGASLITVTSPHGDDGKAQTVFDLASSLAQGGYKTLVVDFDLRHPQLHRYAAA
ncbi:MAG: hypothetical protein ACRCZF_15020, partial [Gemmataceae bacterium]